MMLRFTLLLFTMQLNLIGEIIVLAYCTHGHRQQGARSRTPLPCQIFKHGTNIVDRGLEARAIFPPFFAIFRSFIVALPPRAVASQGWKSIVKK